MTGEVDPWAELAGQLEEAGRPKDKLAREAMATDQTRAALVGRIACGLEVLANGMRQSAMHQAEVLKRTDMRKTLAAVHDHAQGLLAFLDEPSGYGKPFTRPDQDHMGRVGRLQQQLGGFDFAFGPNDAGPLQGIHHTLHELSRRATAALASIPEGGGAGRMPAPNPLGLTAEQQCALVIHEAWAMLNPDVHSGATKTKNEATDVATPSPALKAAAAYWQLCGTAPGERQREAASWKHDFKSIRPEKEADWPASIKWPITNKDGEQKDEEGRLFYGPPTLKQALANPLTRMRWTVRSILTEGEAFWKADSEDAGATTRSEPCSL